MEHKIILPPNQYYLDKIAKQIALVVSVLCVIGLFFVFRSFTRDREHDCMQSQIADLDWRIHRIERVGRHLAMAAHSVMEHMEAEQELAEDPPGTEEGSDQPEAEKSEEA